MYFTKEKGWIFEVEVVVKNGMGLNLKMTMMEEKERGSYTRSLEAEQENFKGGGDSRINLIFV